LAEGDFPFRVGDGGFDPGEQRRQLRSKAGAKGAGRGAVAAVLPAIAVALRRPALFAPPAFAGDGRKRPASYSHRFKRADARDGGGGGN
jgi:hypothetical protein